MVCSPRHRSRSSISRASIPGVILASLFSLTVLLICVIRPELGGKPTSTSWAQRIAALPDLLPPLIIFLAVIGSIYAGWDRDRIRRARRACRHRYRGMEPPAHDAGRC